MQCYRRKYFYNIILKQDIVILYGATGVILYYTLLTMHAMCKCFVLTCLIFVFVYANTCTTDLTGSTSCEHSRDQLLQEGFVEKFLRYVQIDSPSDAEITTVPSTKDQWNMVRTLEKELITLGLDDIRVDKHAILTATLKGNEPNAPVIGFLAHFDSFYGTPNRNIKPIVHKNYNGSEIVLVGVNITTVSHPEIKKCIGHDIITSDGTTLLSADDKAGVAEIMQIICEMLTKNVKRGDVKIAFTPDEETGRGVNLFNVTSFGARAAYTFDGSGLGEVEFENFNAVNLKVTVHGKNAHPGTAKDNMINAVHVASDFVRSIPADSLPETTCGYEGFIHVDSMQGNVEKMTLVVLLRDFTDEGIAHKRKIVDTTIASLETRYKCSITVEEFGGYPNMKKFVERDPLIAALAIKAVEDLGIKIVRKPIRGGTDGATLSAMGLPTPNIFTGGSNYHSKTEWVSVQWMEKAIATGIHLIELWAEQAN
jgi:tripeptide aminopeptidase